MGRIKAILWDVDDTLLHFSVAEAHAIRQTFSDLQIGLCTDDMVAAYSEINRAHWKLLEQGTLTRAQMRRQRFEVFFSRFGLDATQIPAFMQHYQITLGDTVCFYPHALEVLQALQGRVRQYAATNGVSVTQRRKLHKAGLDQIFDGIFISEEIGADKPSAEFFRAILHAIGDVRPDEVLIIGDSLTSDI